tara:strand:- start:393 stop:839 length:447 start_codon:yes stop_codon:yes gene_type:complete
MNGIVIGRKNCEFLGDYGSRLKRKEFMPQDELIKLYQHTNLLLVPNTADASPRVITEALSCGCKILVNRNILGGWKYVTNQTGEFFTNKKDFEQALDKIIRRKHMYKPSHYFRKYYGTKTTGVKLYNFLKKHYSNMKKINTKYVTLLQ